MSWKPKDQVLISITNLMYISPLIILAPMWVKTFDLLGYLQSCSHTLTKKRIQLEETSLKTKNILTINQLKWKIHLTTFWLFTHSFLYVGAHPSLFTQTSFWDAYRMILIVFCGSTYHHCCITNSVIHRRVCTGVKCVGGNVYNNSVVNIYFLAKTKYFMPENISIGSRL